MKSSGRFLNIGESLHILSSQCEVVETRVGWWGQPTCFRVFHEPAPGLQAGRDWFRAAGLHPALSGRMELNA